MDCLSGDVTTDAVKKWHLQLEACRSNLALGH
jgi:hypothetical protein